MRGGEAARQSVLGNVDLLTRILACLPPPKWSCTGFLDKTRSGYGSGSSYPAGRDRFAASHVSRAFRQAALALPWELECSGCLGTPASRGTLARICSSRTLQRWTLTVSSRNPGSHQHMADLVHFATNAHSLQVKFNYWQELQGWLRGISVSPGTGAAAGEGRSVLAWLAALPRLRSLTLSLSPYYHGVCESFDSSSPMWWLIALPQLTHVTVENEDEYSEVAEVPTLPRLKSLCVNMPLAEHTLQLEQWVKPRLTALTLGCCGLLLDKPCSSSLQRLHLHTPHASLATSGSRDLAPGLTYLGLRLGDGESNEPMPDDSTLGILLTSLSSGLKELSLEGPLGRIAGSTWSAISGLESLVSLDILDLDVGKVLAGAKAAVSVLCALPLLKRACLTGRVQTGSQIPSYKAKLEKILRRPKALLLKRGGSLRFSVSC